MTTQPADTRVTATPGRHPDPPYVRALFVDEVNAQEAMGLLAFHGFRTDGIALRLAAGTRWRARFRDVPAQPVPTPHVLGGLVVGLGIGGLLGLGWALAFGSVVAAVVTLAVVGACLGAVVATTSARSRAGGGAPPVLAPDRGCVVSVRTLRVREAGQVLARAGGRLVVPADAPDAEGLGE